MSSIALDEIRFRAAAGVYEYIAPPPPGPLLVVHDVDVSSGHNTRWLAIIDDSGNESYVKEDLAHNQRCPAWSYNYTKIAFERTQWNIAQGGQHDLCIINPDGTGETVVLANTGVDGIETICFSPDGTKLAFRRKYSNLTEVINIDGTGLVTSTNVTSVITMNWGWINWTADSQWIVGVYTTGSPNNEQKLKRWNPSTDQVQTIYDFAPYRDSRGFSSNAPNYFSVVGDLAINGDNIAAVVIQNYVATGVGYDGGTGYGRGGPLFAFVECVPGATPTFVDAENMPNYSWEIYRTQGVNQPPDVITPDAPVSQPLLDDFNRADGALGSNWTDTGAALSISNNNVGIGDTGAGYGHSYWNAAGPWNDMDVRASVNSNTIASARWRIGVRVQTNGDGIYLDGAWVSGAGWQVRLWRRQSSVETLLYSVPNSTFRYTPPGGAGTPMYFGMRIKGQVVSIYSNASTSSGFTRTLTGVQCPWTSGYIGIGALYGTSGTGSGVSINDFQGGQVVTTTPPPINYDYWTYEMDGQLVWSPDDTQIMWHNEVPVPPDNYGGEPMDFFREWQALAMNPDTTNFWTFQYAPNGHLGTTAAFTQYSISQTTPSYAGEAYVPTWAFDNKIVMNAENHDPNWDTSLGYPALTMKGRGLTAQWLKRDPADESAYPIVRVRYAPTGTHIQTWLQDQSH